MSNHLTLLSNTFRTSLTRVESSIDMWTRAEEIVSQGKIREKYTLEDNIEPIVIDWFLRDPHHEDSLLNLAKKIRANSQASRAHLPKEIVSEANTMLLTLQVLLEKPVLADDLWTCLSTAQQLLAVFLNTTERVLPRNEVYDFVRIGQFLERSGNSLRVIGFNYYALLPSAGFVGSRLDNLLHNAVLEDTSSFGVYRSLYGPEIHAVEIINLLFRDQRAPRSLYYCYTKLEAKLRFLFSDYGSRGTSEKEIAVLVSDIRALTPVGILDAGLSETCTDFLKRNQRLYDSIAQDFNFTTQVST